MRMKVILIGNELIH